MSRNAASKPHKPRDDERLFAIIAIIGSLVFGAGFCFLLFAMNNRENNPTDETGNAVENSESRLIAPDHPRQLVNFALTDRTERTVTRSDLDGKILVVDFLFTSCSLTCPAVNSQMAQIQQLTTNQPDVKLVSLTVDPRDDTPAVLEKYAERFGADTNRWLFLTGDRTELYNLIGASFLASDTNDAFSYMPGNFSHTERIAVVDSHGHLRGYFDGLNQNTATAVVNEIIKLRNQNL
ncbi:MAG: SCO family protein [Verrucomicrobiia bacterium]